MIHTETEKNETTRRLRVQMLQGKHCVGAYMRDGEEQQIVFGSCNSADVVLPGDKVSSIHAMLRITSQNDIMLYDLGSQSGTYVLGKRIIQSRVNKGTLFQIGGHSFRLDLLEEDPRNNPEHKLFWESQRANAEVLDIAVLIENKIDSLYHLERNQRLAAGFEDGEILIDGLENSQPFIERRKLDSDRSQEGAYCFLPQGFTAEIYDFSNQLVGNFKEAGQYFCISSNQKARLLGPNQEIQVYWRSQESRLERGTPDPEGKRFRESISVSVALSVIIMAMMWFMPKKEVEENLAESKKGSYFRVTQTEPTQAPAPAPAAAAPAETVDQVVEQQPVAKAPVQKLAQKVEKVVTPQPPKPNQTTVASLSSLSNLLKTTAQKSAAVSDRGRQVMEASIVPVSGGSASLKQELGGQAQAGAVNTSALTQALASGAKGAANGLKGFAGGKGVGLGSSFGNGPPSMDVGLGDSDAESSGGLDKSVIAAIVREHLGQIKHCYERQLLVDPNLFGKVIAHWSINGSGLVDETSVKKSTMGSAAVENCVLAKIRTWKFPKPKGGGKVIVSYPFLFKSVN